MSSSWQGGSSSSGRTTRVGRYILGQTLGQGSSAVVRIAHHVHTNEAVAIKILNRKSVLRRRIADQIQREITIMQRIRHPYIVRIHEVMASKTYIYIVMELVSGGDLFERTLNSGILTEREARKYFQQLICAVDYCHHIGVYHRDLKPENLLVGSDGVLKVSDFGMSALPQQAREDGRLFTACGTKSYVAPEVIIRGVRGGYEGAKADIWSCGVVLFVLLVGKVPFEAENDVLLVHKISHADYTIPSYFSSNARRLVTRLLDPNPETRITMAEIFRDPWFMKDYQPPRFSHDCSDSFDEEGDNLDESDLPVAPVTMNAFQVLSSYLGFNIIGNIFEQALNERETRFISEHPIDVIISTIEQAAASLGFNLRKNNSRMRIIGEHAGRKGRLSIDTEIFDFVQPYLMIELRKAKGDTLEFQRFCKDFYAGFGDIIYKPQSHRAETSGAGSRASTST